MTIALWLRHRRDGISRDSKRHGLSGCSPQIDTHYLTLVQLLTRMYVFFSINVLFYCLWFWSHNFTPGLGRKRPGRWQRPPGPSIKPLVSNVQMKGFTDRAMRIVERRSSNIHCLSHHIIFDPICVLARESKWYLHCKTGRTYTLKLMGHIYERIIMNSFCMRLWVNDIAHSCQIVTWTPALAVGARFNQQSGYTHSAPHIKLWPIYFKSTFCLLLNIPWMFRGKLGTTDCR